MNKRNTKFDWKIFFLLAITVVIIQISYYYVINENIPSLNNRGQFGDMFGALTALFSGFAFAGMITAIVLQTKELGYQREELEYTRQEITEQKEILRMQSFNNSFYRLLDYYKENLHQIKIIDNKNDTSVSGIEALRYLLSRFTTSRRKYKKYFSVSNEEMLKVYEFHLCQGIQNILSHQARYIGTFKSLLYLVNNQLKTDTEKDIYWKIIESQLTSIEIKYLFYQSLVDIDGDFSKTINESEILKNRIQRMGLSTSILTVYERLHGISFTAVNIKNNIPHDRDLILKIKKQLRNEKNIIKRSS